MAVYAPSRTSDACALILLTLAPCILARPLQVVPSRVGMAAPAMFIPPVLMARLEQTAFLKARPALGAPIMVSH